MLLRSVLVVAVVGGCTLDTLGQSNLLTDGGGAAAGSIDASRDVALGGSAGVRDASSDDPDARDGEASPIEEAGDAAIARVTDALVLLYAFDEGSGADVHDSAGFPQAYDLSIQDESKISWMPGFLSVDFPVRITNLNPPQNVLEACQASNEITLEAWLVPGEVPSGSYARIISNSWDASMRNFALMQMGDAWGVRLRTSTNASGQPELASFAGSALKQLTHVVFTRAASGKAVLFMNGVGVAQGVFAGNFSNWVPSFGMIVANEFNDSRPWIGQLHLIAIYSRALASAEVDQNFQAGP